MAHFMYERIINDFNISSNLMFVALSIVKIRKWKYIYSSAWVGIHVLECVVTISCTSKCDLNSFMLTHRISSPIAPNSFSIHINDLFAMIYEFVFERNFPTFDNASLEAYSYCAVIFSRLSNRRFSSINFEWKFSFSFL